MPTTIDDFRQDIPNPVEIVKKLDRYIIGQTIAKQQLAILMLNRALLILQKHGDLLLSSPLPKYNLMMLGHTGSGKTALIRALSKVMDLPITIYDITGTTSSGYRGSDLSDLLSYHWDLAKKYVNEKRFDLDNMCLEPQLVAEQGVIYIDEIDKLRISSDVGRDIVGESIQDELLKYLEGQSVLFTYYDSRDNKRLINIDTSTLFFIVGGAFSGINKIVNKKRKKSHAIGFNAEHNQDESDFYKYITTEDLIEYGFKSEFLGRLALRAPLEALNVDSLFKIMTDAEDSVYRQYQAFFSAFNKCLIIKKDAMQEICKKAFDLKIGARALSSIFQSLLAPYLLNIFSMDDNVVINKQDVENMHDI